MGLVVPEDFPLGSLTNDAERTVVEVFRDRLSDDWLVFPDVGLALDRDHQMDVVLAHPRDGVAVIEVKGHRVELRDGLFHAHGRPMDPQPDVQARHNAYELRGRLRLLGGPLSHVRVEYAIAFPNTLAVRGRLPPDVLQAQVLTGPALEQPVDAIEGLLAARGWGGAIGSEAMDAVVRELRPSATLEWDPEARARRARRRMDALCAERVRALEALDINRRVAVSGGAGSGKSRLAVAWSRRAAGRGERVLLVCFNDPLAEDLRRRVREHEDLTVGSFFDVAFRLRGMPPLERPVTADAEWWDTIAVGHLQRHWPSVVDRFDVVIVDEAQDFSPAWLALLAELLDGPRRLMLLTDPAQGIFARGFTPPRPEDGWTLCELEDNCRNTFGIATLLHDRLDGGRPLAGPESLDVRWRLADDIDEIVDRVGEEIDHVERTYATRRVLVATTTRLVRDRLRNALALVPWDDRSDSAIVCENVQRVKGLEYDVVILVAGANISDLLLYVGISRAVVGLSIVAPSSVAERLGLAPVTVM